MKVLGICGSPRKGNTEWMLIKLFDYMAGSGLDTEIILLREKEIRGCDGCLACDMGGDQRKGVCRIKDNMQEICPNPTGASMALRDPALDNNIGDNWCTASTPYGAGDLGTPGAENDCDLPPSIIEVTVDIKPGSNSNLLNVNSKGVLPVAILGTEDFDVMSVNASTVVLSWRGITLPAGSGGVPPLCWAWEDVNCDGFMDISLKYSMKVMVPFTVTHEAPGDLTMMLKGNLMEEYDGTPIAGEYTVRIINKGYAGP